MLSSALRIGTVFVLLAVTATAASARPHSHHARRIAGLHAGRHHADDSHHRRHSHHHRAGVRLAHGRRHHRTHVAHGGGGGSASRACLTGETRTLLNRVEAKFSHVQIVSTCRPGAVVAGTGRPSQHRYGRAVDFNAPAAKKAAIVAWLAANNRGGTMTYAHVGHIHMDTAARHFVSLGSGGRGGHHASRAYASRHRHVRTAQAPVRTRHQASARTYASHSGYGSAPAYTGNPAWSGTSMMMPASAGGYGQPIRALHHHHHRHAGGFHHKRVRG